MYILKNRIRGSYKVQKIEENRMKMGVDMIKVAIYSDQAATVGQIERLIFDLCQTKGIPAETEVFHSEITLKKEIEGEQDTICCIWIFRQRAKRES